MFSDHVRGGDAHLGNDGIGCSKKLERITGFLK
jgi:hypothetical protein